MFSASLTTIGSVCLVLLACFVDYAKDQSDAKVNQHYSWFLHVSIMIFVGFGFLMTFLRHYSYSAVGFNFFASCLMLGHAHVHTIELDLPLLIDAAFCAGAAMVTFGAVLGKVSPTQLTWLLTLEVPLYAANTYIASRLGALDIGGSMTIHAFGAFYGLAASLVLSKPGSGSSHAKNGATYTSDITAMIGTIFLWIFWPSFNGALASDPSLPASSAQFHCVMNTVLSLIGACLSAFALSAAYHGKLDMVHIQNSTLAGGVAIGSAANMDMAPAAALGVGMVAGTVSVLGFRHISPYLETKVGLRDTCGVHNLHGLPGILGGVVAALILVVAPHRNALLLSHGRWGTAGFQLAALGASLLLATVGGVCAGRLVAAGAGRMEPEDAFEDARWWDEIEAESETALEEDRATGPRV
eukprot:jgi/Astpho2/4350/Aster-08052